MTERQRSDLWRGVPEWPHRNPPEPEPPLWLCALWALCVLFVLALAAIGAVTVIGWLS
jgi:hypothetical protein